MQKFLLLLAFLVIGNCLWTELTAQTGPKLSIQGTLKDANNNAVSDGMVSVTFKLYTDSTGGTALWSETASVEVVGGIYSHKLGSVNSLNTDHFANTLYLGVTVAGSELTPRAELTYSPYALSVNTAQNASNIIGNNNGKIYFDNTGKLFVKTNNVERFSIGTNGNVGIGANGSNYDLAIGDTDTGIDQIADGHLNFVTNGTTRMTMNSNGRIGIGNFTDPIIDLAIGDGDTGIDQMGDGELAFLTNNAERLRIKPDGRVGIGTNDPWAPLHVTGTNTSINTPEGDYIKYDIANSTVGNTTMGFGQVVAFFNGDVVASGGVASFRSPSQSDERIKNVIGVSDAKKDLDLLQQLRITDYTYKDVVAHPGKSKMVIAQQVEKIYPQAVSAIYAVVPNIYSTATKVEAKDGQLSITLSKKHELLAGDRIDIKTPVKELSRVEVSQIIDDYSFVVNTDVVTDRAFVFGKYVNDFRVVDYDALSMLNLSASQELYRMIQELKKENEALRNENSTLRTQEANTESRLARLEALVNALGTGTNEVKASNNGNH